MTGPLSRRLTVFIAHPSELLTDHLPHGDGLVSFGFVRRLAERGHDVHVAAQRADIREPLRPDFARARADAGQRYLDPRSARLHGAHAAAVPPAEPRHPLRPRAPDEPGVHRPQPVAARRQDAARPRHLRPSLARRRRRAGGRRRRGRGAQALGARRAGAVPAGARRGAAHRLAGSDLTHRPARPASRPHPRGAARHRPRPLPAAPGTAAAALGAVPGQRHPPQGHLHAARGVRARLRGGARRGAGHRRQRRRPGGCRSVARCHAGSAGPAAGARRPQCASPT